MMIKTQDRHRSTRIHAKFSAYISHTWQENDKLGVMPFYLAFQTNIQIASDWKHPAHSITAGGHTSSGDLQHCVNEGQNNRE